MSYHIEYNRALFKLPSSEGGATPLVLLFIKGGDNNVEDTDTGLRARDWYVAFFGEEKDFWPYIGHRAGNCQGGSLQRAQGWSDTKCFSVEEYIALYRKTFRLAKTIEVLFSSYTASLWIELRGNKKRPMALDDMSSQGKREAIAGFLDKSGKSFSLRTDYYGYRISEVTVPLENPESLMEALTMRGHFSSPEKDFRGHVDILFQPKEGRR